MEQEERDQLELIADSEDFSGARRRRAATLLLADIGPNGPGMSLSEIERKTGNSVTYCSRLVGRAMEKGPVLAVMAEPRIGQGQGHPRKKKLAPETELEIALADSTGQFTRAELARRYGVQGGTIAKIVDRNPFKR